MSRLVGEKGEVDHSAAQVEGGAQPVVQVGIVPPVSPHALVVSVHSSEMLPPHQHYPVEVPAILVWREPPVASVVHIAMGERVIQQEVGAQVRIRVHLE